MNHVTTTTTSTEIRSLSDLLNGIFFLVDCLLQMVLVSFFLSISRLLSLFPFTLVMWHVSFDWFGRHKNQPHTHEPEYYFWFLTNYRQGMLLDDCYYQWKATTHYYSLTCRWVYSSSLSASQTLTRVVNQQQQCPSQTPRTLSLSLRIQKKNRSPKRSNTLTYNINDLSVYVCRRSRVSCVTYKSPFVSDFSGLWLSVVMSKAITYHGTGLFNQRSFSPNLIIMSTMMNFYIALRRYLCLLIYSNDPPRHAWVSGSGQQTNLIFLFSG